MLATLSISNYLDKKDSDVSSREDADELYSHQAAGAETITKEVEFKLRKPIGKMLQEEKMVIRSVAGPPIRMSLPECPPNASREEDKGDVVTGDCGIEEEDQSLEPAALPTLVADTAEQGEAEQVVGR